MLLKLAMIVSFSFPVVAIAQSAVIPLDIEDQVLNIIFPVVGRPPQSFFTKMTLRYGDTDTQFVVVTYLAYPPHPGGQCEVIRYSIEGMPHEKLSEFIATAMAENPNVTAQGIAQKLKVNIVHFPIDVATLQRAMKDLKALRISPVLQTRIALDNSSKYEFWYDTGQEYVHYSITGPFKGDTQDQLVQWMIRFRSNLPELLKAPSILNP